MKFKVNVAADSVDPLYIYLLIKSKKYSKIFRYLYNMVFGEQSDSAQYFVRLSHI